MKKIVFFELSVVIIAFVVVVGAIGFVSTYYFPKDGPIEQVAEKIIKDQTGLEIDFTPEDK